MGKYENKDGDQYEGLCYSLQCTKRRKLLNIAAQGSWAETQQTVCISGSH